MSLHAADIMTRRTITASPDDTVAEIASRLLENDIRGLPVCDKDGRPVGMITEGDLLRPFANDERLHHPWWLALLAHGEPVIRQLADHIKLDKRRAYDLMTSPVISVTEDTRVTDIARLLLQSRINGVPVVNDKKVVGVVSRADVICALAQRPHALDDEWQPAPAGGNLPLCDWRGRGRNNPESSTG